MAEENMRGDSGKRAIVQKEPVLQQARQAACRLSEAAGRERRTEGPERKKDPAMVAPEHKGLETQWLLGGSSWEKGTKAERSPRPAWESVGEFSRHKRNSKVVRESQLWTGSENQGK